MNRSEEDYIKTIYELSINTNKKIIKNIEIAEHLGFTDQSVNEMVKKLSNKGYLDFIPYKGVKLTKEGFNQAYRLIRAHRVWEVFLMKHLNYSWSDVHEQAEFLEHSGSSDLIERLYKFLDEPKYCMHGNPIPKNDGAISQVFNKSLYMFKTGEAFVLKRVLDIKELLEFLDKENLKINDEFLLEDKSEFTGIFKLLRKHDQKEFLIPTKISKMLFGINTINI